MCHDLEKKIIISLKLKYWNVFLRILSDIDVVSLAIFDKLKQNLEMNSLDIVSLKITQL